MTIPSPEQKLIDESLIEAIASVDSLLDLAGFSPESSIRHQLSISRSIARALLSELTELREKAEDIEELDKTARELLDEARRQITLVTQERDALKKQLFESHQKAIRDGYAGVLPNGGIVDRRVYPEAMPIPANSYLGVPEPKGEKT